MDVGTGLMTRPPLAFKDFHLSILTSLDSVETVPGGGARLDWKCKRLLLLRIYFYSPSGHYFSGVWTLAPHRNTRIGDSAVDTLSLSALGILHFKLLEFNQSKNEVSAEKNSSVDLKHDWLVSQIMTPKG